MTADSFETVAGDPAGGLLLVVDHASPRVPAPYGDLGLPEAEFRRHIAYDIGMAELGRALAARLDAPLVMSTFSRLVIDANRGDDDPTLVMRLSDGAVIPGNARIDAAEKDRRLARFWRPYHAEIDRVLDAMLATGVVPAILSLHSFTPAWKGRARPWQAGILWDRDPRLARPLIDALAADPALTVGDNEPYDGALKGDSMYRHGTMRGLAHAIVEVRQDLVADAAGIAGWAERLGTVMAAVRHRPDLHTIHRFGSRSDADG